MPTCHGVGVSNTILHHRDPGFESRHGHGYLYSSWSQKPEVKTEGESLRLPCNSPKYPECGNIFEAAIPIL